MYATADDVAANWGQPLTETQRVQVEKWIQWTEGILSARLGDLALRDADTVNMVIVEAVTRRLHMPEPVTQVSVSVDDANVAKTYPRSTGLIEILPEWWTALGWIGGAGAFSIRPAFLPDSRC